MNMKPLPFDTIDQYMKACPAIGSNLGGIKKSIFVAGGKRSSKS